MLKRPAAGKSASHRCDAISLIEVLTVLAVSVVILITGMPSVAQWVRAMDIHNSASRYRSATLVRLTQSL